MNLVRAQIKSWDTFRLWKQFLGYNAPEKDVTEAAESHLWRNLIVSLRLMFHSAFFTVPARKKTKATGEAQSGNWLVGAKLLNMFAEAIHQLRWHFNTLRILGIFPKILFLRIFFLSCFVLIPERIDQFPTEKLDFSKHQFGVLTVCEPKRQQLDPRFSTTKRAFDDFLRTIRELKKLRCCWDLWRPKMWRCRMCLLKNVIGCWISVKVYVRCVYLYIYIYILNIRIYIYMYTHNNIYTFFSLVFR